MGGGEFSLSETHSSKRRNLTVNQERWMSGAWGGESYDGGGKIIKINFLLFTDHDVWC